MGEMSASVEVSLGRQGRLVIPAPLRRALKARFAQVPVERALVDELSAAAEKESSSKPAVLLQQGNHLSDSSGVGFAGLDLVAELDKIALSLASSSESRAFSLFSCSISLSSCFNLCSRAIDLISISTTGCQLSLDSQRRQGGSEDKYSDLLIKAEGCTPKEVDMVVSSKKRDQGQ